MHRDIKPSNLFLLGNGTVKVLDFGIARLPSSRLTVAGSILGTPNYMAPEQILARPSDARADLFSAAVVLFELLVYVHPFQSPLIPRRIIEGEPDSLFDHDSSMPVVLERVVARALAKDPAQRYASAEEFSGDLKAVLDAVRMESSPTFSRVELPSDRAIPPAEAVAAPEVPIVNAEPEGGDPEESRLAKVLELLPQFEAAADRGDHPAARKTFDELKAIEAVDPRFTEALNNCRSRLWELEPTPAPGPPAAAVAVAGQSRTEASSGASGDSPLKQKTCTYCGGSNRAAALYCIKCGGRFDPAATVTGNVMGNDTQTVTRATLPSARKIELDDSVLGIPAVSATKPPSQEARPLRPAPSSEPAPRPTPPSAVAPGKAPSKTPPATGQEAPSPRPLPFGLGRKTVLIAAGVLVCILLLVLLMLIFRKVPIEPFVATAALSVDGASMYDSPDVSSSVVGKLKRGDEVNVLKPPSSSAEWVAVQRVKGGKVLPKGYVALTALERWSDSKIAWDLRPPTGIGSDQEPQSQLDWLAAFARSYAGRLEAKKAALEK